MRLAALALAAALAASVPPACAAPFAVNLGETRIGLDAPPGFADTGFTGSPRLIELAQSLTSASNRILLFALSDEDLRRFTLGDAPELRRYMIAVTPREFERSHVSPGRFAQFVADAARGLAPPAADTDIAQQLAALGPGKSVLLAQLRRDSLALSTLSATRLPDESRDQDKPRYLLTSDSLLRLRGRIISLSVFTQFDSTADLDWIRRATARWIEDLQRLNRF